jgi:DNA-binding NarL/FixJ family response regulator
MLFISNPFWILARDSYCLTQSLRQAKLCYCHQFLVVDDYEAWRREVRSLFQSRPQWQVIAEAVDGLEANQKAEELKPDLILLDIGLPNLHGIEAARRIRQVSPGTKIVFLSQNSDLEIVQAALDTGALGHVHKICAKSDLLHAVEAVLRGEQFVREA